MAREKKKKEEQQGELNPEAEERKRLKKLAYSNNILSEAPANGFNPLTPSKTVVKHHGKDILKKSQRKNRYLFSFSGLLAPISGGKIGELTDLGSKNPVLYLDFPQGRVKLFGTIVYPKNRYLTLQFSRGGKSVMCEDCFDTVIVFSDACWVGRKEDNPDEARLDFPKEIFQGNYSEVDFQGGAGAGAMRNKEVKKVITKSTDESLPESPLDDMETESSEGTQNTTDMTNITPVRHSERTAGKKFRFAEASSEDDSAETVSDMSGGENEEATKSSRHCSLDQDPGAPKTKTVVENSGGIQLLTRPNTEQAPLPALPNSEAKESSHGSLVQATISTLFKKVEEKNTTGGSRKMAISKDSNKKMQQSSIASKSKKKQAAELGTAQNSSEEKQAGKRNYRKKQKAEAPEVEDDIEEFISASEGTDGSDEDWHA